MSNDEFTVTSLLSKSTATLTTPPKAFTAFSTLALQCPQVIPSTTNVFTISLPPILLLSSIFSFTFVSSISSISFVSSIILVLLFTLWLYFISSLILGLKNFNLKAFDTTETLLKLIAAPANIGFNFQPSTP